MTRLLSQLNRWLNRKGDTITLRRYFGTGPTRTNTDLTLVAKVKGLTEQQLIGNVAQQTFMVIMSPTPLIADGWPHVSSPAITPDQVVSPSSSARLPTTTDKVVVRGKERAISRVVPVFQEGLCLRIELTATG